MGNRLVIEAIRKSGELRERLRRQEESQDDEQNEQSGRFAFHRGSSPSVPDKKLRQPYCKSESNQGRGSDPVMISLSRSST